MKALILAVLGLGFLACSPSSSNSTPQVPDAVVTETSIRELTQNSWCVQYDLNNKNRMSGWTYYRSGKVRYVTWDASNGYISYDAEKNWTMDRNVLQWDTEVGTQHGFIVSFEGESPNRKKKSTYIDDKSNPFTMDKNSYYSFQCVPPEKQR